MRIALPKGRLLDGVLDALARAGLTFRFQSDRDYNPVSSDPAVRAKLIKVRAIPHLVALGNFEAGFAGLDLLQEAACEEVFPLLDLQLNRVTLVVAVPRGMEKLLEMPPKRPLLIATEYERISHEWAMSHNLAHITIQTWGSTEAYAPEDADIVFDNVETGRTMAANNMAVIDEIMTSSTNLIVNRSTYARPEIRAAIDALADGLRRAIDHDRH